jgi:phosphoglycerol geranylgeranyltransferase
MEYYKAILTLVSEDKKGLAILIDPDKFNVSETASFLLTIPANTTHLFVGGSIVSNGDTETTVIALKKETTLPVILFPGDYSQITHKADALLFLSLLSGRNAEYLVGQQVKSIAKLKTSALEIIATGYLLIDGGNDVAVARVSNTSAMPQDDIDVIVNTALAGQYMGAKLIYLEAGSGAKYPVKAEVIKAVREAINVPLIVGGGIKTENQKQAAYNAGANIIVMGTAFEN